MLFKISRIVITLFFLGSTFAYAEVVNKVVIKGNKRVSEETIKVYGEIKTNKDYSESDINKVLNNLYSTNFFEDVNLELKNNIFTINVKEYPVVNQLVFTGENNKRYISEIKKLIKLKEKQSFIKSYLSQDVETIKKLYSSVGYNFSKIEIKIKNLDENKIDLLFDINKYPLLHAYLQNTPNYSSGVLPDWRGHYPGQIGDHLNGDVGSKHGQRTAKPSGGSPKSSHKFNDGHQDTANKAGGTHFADVDVREVTIDTGWDSVTRPKTVAVHFIIKHD